MQSSGTMSSLARVVPNTRDPLAYNAHGLYNESETFCHAVAGGNLSMVWCRGDDVLETHLSSRENLLGR